MKLAQIYGPLLAFALSLQLVMFYLTLTVVIIMIEMRYVKILIHFSFNSFNVLGMILSCAVVCRLFAGKF